MTSLCVLRGVGSGLKLRPRQMRPYRLAEQGIRAPGRRVGVKHHRTAATRCGFSILCAVRARPQTPGRPPPMNTPSQTNTPPARSPEHEASSEGDYEMGREWGEGHNELVVICKARGLPGVEPESAIRPPRGHSAACPPGPSRVAMRSNSPCGGMRHRWHKAWGDEASEGGSKLQHSLRRPPAGVCSCTLRPMLLLSGKHPARACLHLPSRPASTPRCPPRA